MTYIMCRWEVNHISRTITVSDDLVRRLNDLSIAPSDDLAASLQRLVVAEYQRRLARYRLTDHQLTRKYGMSFAAFEHQQITRQHGYTWEVESDAIAWETAVDGIATMMQALAGMDEASK